LHHRKHYDAGACRFLNGEYRPSEDAGASSGAVSWSSSADRNCVFTEEARLIPIQQSSGGITFAVKLHPRAKRNAIVGEVGDALKLSLTAPPLDGKANRACLEFFAKLLKVPRSSVTIASGQTNRTKIIYVAGVSAHELRTRIAI
jgi:uncharacterized protein